MYLKHFPLSREQVLPVYPHASQIGNWSLLSCTVILMSPLVLIHRPICAVNHIVHTFVQLRIINGHTPCDVYLLPTYFGFRTPFEFRFVKLILKCIPVLIVHILENNRKFITANPEHRAMIENITNELTSRFQVNIPLVMPVLVVDRLEIVAIEYTDCKSCFSPETSISACIFAVYRSNAPLL